MQEVARQVAAHKGRYQRAALRPLASPVHVSDVFALPTRQSQYPRAHTEWPTRAPEPNENDVDGGRTGGMLCLQNEKLENIFIGASSAKRFARVDKLKYPYGLNWDGSREAREREGKKKIGGIEYKVFARTTHLTRISLQTLTNCAHTASDST